MNPDKNPANLSGSPTPRTDGIIFKAQPGMMPPYDTVPAAFARTLERELILATKGELSGNSGDNSQYVANYSTPRCDFEFPEDAYLQGDDVLKFARNLERELSVALAKLAAAERAFIEINMVAPTGEVSALTFRAIQGIKEAA